MMIKRRQRGKGERCTHCKQTLEATGTRSNLAATRDHYPIPKWKGGRLTVWACILCNSTKGGMTAEEWAAYMNANPDWYRARARRRQRYRTLRISADLVRLTQQYDLALRAIAKAQAESAETAKPAAESCP